MINNTRRIIAYILLFLILTGFGLPTSVYAKDTRANKIDIVPIQERIYPPTIKPNQDNSFIALINTDKAKKKDGKEEHRVLTIIHTSPDSSSIGIPVNTSIKITFNKPISSVWNIDKRTNNKGITLRSINNKDIPITCSVSNDTLIIKPIADLEYRTKYELIVPENVVRGIDKTKLHQNFRLVFTTKELESTIISINDIVHTVYQGDNYSLPKTVMANMSDGTSKEVPVIWNPSTADTSMAGTYILQGTVEGYNRMVILKLTVIAKDTTKPTVTDIIKVSLSKVAIFFSEAMDGSSITDPANYAYVGGDGITKVLPAACNITTDNNNKQVFISFPTGYSVVGSSAISQYEIKGIRIANVKDCAGNILDGIAVTKEVKINPDLTPKPKYVNNTFKLFKDSSKAWAEFELDQVLAAFDYRDFYITDEAVAGGVTSAIAPDSGYLSGRKIVLNFDKSGKRELIMAQGPNAKLFTASRTVSVNSSGISIAPIDGVQVYDDQIAPEWTKITDNSYVLVTTNVAAYGVTGLANNTACVVLKFTEALDNTISGLYRDDFIFTQEGRLLTVTNTIVNGQYLVYVFKSDSSPVADVTKRLTVKAKSTVDIRDKIDLGTRDYNNYVPKTDDLNGRYWGN